MKTTKTKVLAILVLALGLMVCPAELAGAAPMGTGFTYQGRLVDHNIVANGQYDFQFKVFDNPDVSLGDQKGNTIYINELNVKHGNFTVELDFGSGIFYGDARWLEIGVRPASSTDSFTILSPLQEIKPTPNSIHATHALQADEADTLNGLDSSAFAVTAHSHDGVYALIGHTHSGSDITTGTVADGLIAASIARDSEITWKNLDGIPDGFSDGIDNDSGGDNLGNHTATQNIKLSGHYLSGDGGNEGIYVTNGGYVGIGTTNPTAPLHIYTLGNYIANALTTGASDLIFNVVPGSNKDFVLNNNGAGEGGIALSIANNKKLVVANKGNVGIGTTNPQELLDIAGNKPVLRITSKENKDTWVDSEELASISFFSSDSASSAVVGKIEAVSEMESNWGNRWGLAFHTYDLGLSEAMRISEKGNVGIGTTSPETNAKLHAVTSLQDYSARAVFGESRFGYGVFGKAGTGQGVVGVSGSGKDPYERQIGKYIGVYGDGGEGYGGYFLGDVYASGNVGIGTPSPTEKLEVAGNAKITGNLTVDGMLTGSGINADTLDGLDSTAFSLDGHIQDDRYYTETELQSSGSASVHWDNLNSVPAGFSDGIDDVGGGDSDWTISGNDMYSGVSGNVGIGTTNPQSKLSVGGNGFGNTGVYAKGTNIGVYGEGNWGGYFIGKGCFGGDVGIGTDNPIAKLHVEERGSASPLRVNVSGSTKLIVKNDGKVGIGTMSPTAKLHISGTSGVDGIKFPDGTLQTTAAGEPEPFVRGSYIICENNVGRATNSQSYTKLKEIKLGRGGTLDIRYFVAISGLGGTAYGRVYRNGTPVGAEFHTVLLSGIHVWEAIGGWSKGDLLQVYGKLEGGAIESYANINSLVISAGNPIEAGARVGY